MFYYAHNLAKFVKCQASLALPHSLHHLQFFYLTKCECSIIFDLFAYTPLASKAIENDKGMHINLF